MIMLRPEIKRIEDNVKLLKKLRRDLANVIIRKSYQSGVINLKGLIDTQEFYIATKNDDDTIILRRIDDDNVDNLIDTISEFKN